MVHGAASMFTTVNFVLHYYSRSSHSTIHRDFFSLTNSCNMIFNIRLDLVQWFVFGLNSWWLRFVSAVELLRWSRHRWIQRLLPAIHPANRSLSLTHVLLMCKSPVSPRWKLTRVVCYQVVSFGLNQEQSSSSRSSQSNWQLRQHKAHIEESHGAIWVKDWQTQLWLHSHMI